MYILSVYMPVLCVHSFIRDKVHLSGTSAFELFLDLIMASLLSQCCVKRSHLTYKSIERTRPELVDSSP